MAKTKKKRTKRYSGTDAAVTRPVIRRYEAVERGPLRQWFHDHKTRVKIFGVLAAIAGILTVFITGIASLIR